jgi:hypothetical protein
MNLAERFHEAVDECEVLLTVWAAWMRTWEGPEGYPAASMGFENPGYFRSVETLYDDAEAANKRTMAEAAEAVINSLPPAQTCAIHHEYGFTAVYRFRDYPATLEAARDGFMVGMRKRGF